MQPAGTAARRHGTASVSISSHGTYLVEELKDPVGEVGKRLRINPAVAVPTVGDAVGDDRWPADDERDDEEHGCIELECRRRLGRVVGVDACQPQPRGPGIKWALRKLLALKGTQGYSRNAGDVFWGGAHPVA